MAAISEILSSEKERTDAIRKRTIFFYPDGSFYRAYEWSAWLCVRYLRQFKITRRRIKSIDSDMLFIGFPKSSLDKFRIDGAEMNTSNEQHVSLILPEEMVLPDLGGTLEEEFTNWRETIPLTEAKESKKDSPGLTTSSQPVSLTGIMRKILSFPVEKKTPIDSMLFLIELKEELSAFL